MHEYIEKFKVVDLLTRVENDCQKYKPFDGYEEDIYRAFTKAEIVIGKMPAADVVAVVRCKECHFSCDEGDDGAVWCKNWNQYIGCDCFCSHGERRDGDG